MYSLNVNGKVQKVDAEPEMPLLWVIREVLGLTGTKFGCGIAQCGACTVHVDGQPIRSCSVPGSALTGRKITTIEGLSTSSNHPVQKAWAEVDVPQCGYCQSGQIMAATALLKRKAKPTDKDIDEAMTNICRCGTYQRIREAIHVAAGTKNYLNWLRVKCQPWSNKSKSKVNSMNTLTSNTSSLSRRSFMLGTSAMAGGGLALGMNLFVSENVLAQATDAFPEVGVWVLVKPDDTCVIRIVRSEMGQGTRTGLAQLVAEELECDWSKVTTETPTPGQNLQRKRAWGDMSTGGSGAFELRKIMFAAAAQRPASCCCRPLPLNGA